MLICSSRVNNYKVFIMMMIMMIIIITHRTIIAAIKSHTMQSLVARLTSLLIVSEKQPTEGRINTEQARAIIILFSTIKAAIPLVRLDTYTNARYLQVWLSFTFEFSCPQVKSSYARGDVEGAEKCSKKANRCAIIGILTGAIMISLVVCSSW